MKGGKKARPVGRQRAVRKSGNLDDLCSLIDGDEGGLLGEVARFIRRYVVMRPAQLVAVSLWVMHTHAIEAAEQTPYLAITSPDRQCGKTRLMEVLELLVPRPWLMELPSEAVLYRTIHASTPTLLWDEIDTVFNPRNADRYEGQRAVVNSGNRRGVTVPRCVGNTSKVFDFNVYCAKALAGIGTLPDTIADRSLPIRLQRRNPKTERAERFRRREAEPPGHSLRNRIARWTARNRKSLTRARPTLPDELSDRMQDSCEPLLAIADRFERPWSKLARLALVELCTGERPDDIETKRLRLLRDLKEIFVRLDRRSLPTARLLKELHALPESPWKNYYGHEFEDRDLARLLRHYGISSRRLRVKKKVLMGYKRADLHDAWERYT